MPGHLPPTTVLLPPSALRAGISSLRDTDAPADFRAALRRHLGVTDAVLASSGRTALYVLLEELRKRRDRPERRDVVLPAYTCPALVTVIQAANLRPRLVDVCTSTLAMRAEALDAVLGERTLAVVHVHPFGIPLPLDDVTTRAHDVGAVVIEDAAQAMGARLEDRLVGAIGDFGLFSLGPGKPLSTGGGGILTAKTEEYPDVLGAARARLPASPALRSAFALARLIAFAAAFHPAGWWLVTRLRLNRIGDMEVARRFAVRALTPAQARVGTVLLGRLDGVNGQRRANAERLIARLHDYRWLHIPTPAVAATPIYLRLPLLVDTEERRNRLHGRLQAAGIGAGTMYRQPLSALFPRIADGAYEGADSAARRLLTLPTHHHLSPLDIERMAMIVHSMDDV